MKIEITTHENTSTLETAGVVRISEAYVGIGIETPDGFFCIAQRDGGIEVVFEGKTIFASAKMHDQDELEGDLRIAIAMMATVLEQKGDGDEVLGRPAVESSVRHARDYLDRLLSAQATPP